MAEIFGSIELLATRSPRHARFLSQVDDLEDVHHLAPIVRIELYALPTLEATDADAPPSHMSIECFLQRRLSPVQSLLELPDHSSGIPGRVWCYEYSFKSVPAGRYHVLAYTIGNDDPDSQQYDDPQRQAFGFYARHDNGDRWPWSVVTVTHRPVQLTIFSMQAPHSFAWLREHHTAGDGTAPISPKSRSLMRQTKHARLKLLSPTSAIPVLTYQSCTPAERGHSHGLLLAPYILDFWTFYLFEQRFAGNRARYEEFINRWVEPAHGFFAYPQEALLEAEGVIAGMQASGISMELEPLGRSYDVRDVLASFIETRTVIAGQSAHVQAAATAAAAAASATAAAAAAVGVSPLLLSVSPRTPSHRPRPSISHHCSQAVVWGQHTGGGSVLAGRNMDGELDVRKVTVTHTMLFATDRDLVPHAPTPDGEVPAPSAASYRTISMMWPSIIGTLTGVNETGLYLCENAGDTQPDSGIVSGLAPVVCVQQAALRQLDGRTLTIAKMRQFLTPYISQTGWDTAAHRKTTEAERAQKLTEDGVPTYVSETSGGFAGPGSIFVVALPPVAGEATASSSAPSSSSRPVSASASASSPSSSSPRGFIVEADRSHTCFRTAGPSAAAPPFLPECLIATNHFLKLGFDDQGVVSRAQESLRSGFQPEKKCASLSAAHAGSYCTNEFTNWNERVSLASQWRFEAGRNRLQAWHRQKRWLTIEDVQDLLQVMCPGATEHSFAAEMTQEGRVIVHVAVATASAGCWDAPYATWHSFNFHELFE